MLNRLTPLTPLTPRKRLSRHRSQTVHAAYMTVIGVFALGLIFTMKGVRMQRQEINSLRQETESLLVQHIGEQTLWRSEIAQWRAEEGQRKAAQAAQARAEQAEALLQRGINAYQQEDLRAAQTYWYEATRVGDGSPAAKKATLFTTRWRAGRILSCKIRKGVRSTRGTPCPRWLPVASRRSRPKKTISFSELALDE